MCYITAHRYSVFDVCYATLGYHVLCRYTKHADLFEPELLGETKRGSALSNSQPACKERMLVLLNCCLYDVLPVIYYAGSSSLLKS